MPITGSLTPKQLAAGMNTKFNAAMQAREQELAKILSILDTVPSTKESETYPILGELPGVEEWISKRTEYELSEYYKTVANRDWIVTIAFNKNTIDDEQYGAIMQRAMAAGRKFVQHKVELLALRLMQGISGAILAYDGQNFFDTDHSSGSSGAQSNKLTATLDDDGLTTAMNAMKQLKDDQGKLMGIWPDTIVVPTAKSKSARQLTESLSLTDATGLVNIHRGIEIIEFPWLDAYSEDIWFLMQLKTAYKAIILQERKALKMGWINGLTPDMVTEEKFVKYGGDARYEIMPVFWPAAAACDASGSFSITGL